jgi:hypothetical protein
MLSQNQFSLKLRLTDSIRQKHATCARTGSTTSQISLNIAFSQTTLLRVDVPETRFYILDARQTASCCSSAPPPRLSAENFERATRLRFVKNDVAINLNKDIKALHVIAISTTKQNR